MIKVNLFTTGVQKYYFLLLLTWLSDYVYAQKIQLHFDEGEQGGWVPFRTGAQANQSGVLTDVTQLISVNSEIEFIPVPLPARRAQQALEKGLIDFDIICLEWLNQGQKSQSFVTSEPLFEVTEHLITLPSKQNLFPDRASIFGKYVGTIAGYFYFDDSQFKRVDFLNENQLLLGLKHKRFDVIILERETAKYWASQHKMDIKFTALHSKGNLLIRLRQEHAELMPQINETIQYIKQSGALQNILDKHGVDSKVSYTKM
ncbi:substrate-binding periplasmic protein [Paraglaciecola sp. 2405UD69-4]|uniref:substrate-binding periplasmic protein n=1 Tax=Paraglaciecola sp. 2405UD69-4 TaxID=3391836 RepID=UPI0039C9A4B7